MTGTTSKKTISLQQRPDTIEVLDAALFPAVCLPFNGRQVFCIVRELSHAQIASCGEFSLIETMKDQLFKKKTMSYDDMVKFAEIQHNVCKLAMINPTYQQVIDLASRNLDISGFENRLKDIQEKFIQLTPCKEKAELQEKYALIELSYKFILPTDFSAHVFSYAIGYDRSDIKLITEDMLYNAAIKAKLGNDNPADHIGGVFTDFNREDINNRAWIIFQERQKAGKNGR